MDSSWISIAITSLVLLVQLTSRYHQDEAASGKNLRTLEALLLSKIAELQIQIAKLPDEMMTRVSLQYVTVDRYAAEIDNIKSRLHSIEREIGS
jgi:hypothetical protein